jgi:DNA (cytosine-5)-methyltransferase 1
MIHGELIVDNFAGGGGASTGIEIATGYSVDIAINHDPEAIRMHKANHPNTKHYCEDVWQVDPVEACKGHPVGLAWFSPDCKHFSKAKGGKPKDKFIRGLAWVACRWAGLVRPRVIMLENVEEFKTWGPLNRSHRPIKEKQGVTFQKFVGQLKDLGYEVEYRELVAADYGAPTMRKRFFLIARCDGKPIVWPEPTYAPADSEEVKAGLLKPYVGAYTQLDFSLPCPSIFDTSEEIKEKYGIRAVRPLAQKTMDRIARGLKKFVLDNPDPFIIQCNQQCLISPTLIQYHSETSKDGVRGQAIEDPIMTVDSSNRYGLVTSFLHKYYDGRYKGAGETVENPLPTVTAWDHNSVVTANLIQMNNHCDGKDIKQPLPTITAGDGHFGVVRAFLIKYYGQGIGQDIQKPLDTVTAQDRFGLVTINGTDYQIVDIGLRMLEPKELYGCQGFPDDYIIDHDYTGKTYPRSEQVKRCGNAVCPPIPAALVRANLPELCVAERMPNMRITTEQDGQMRFS